MGFPRQEYSSGLPFPSPGDLLDPGIEPVSLTSPALAGGFFTTEPSEKSHICVSSCCYFMPSSAVSISCPVRPSLTSHLSQKPGNQLRCPCLPPELCQAQSHTPLTVGPATVPLPRAHCTHLCTPVSNARVLVTPEPKPARSTRLHTPSTQQNAYA